MQWLSLYVDVDVVIHSSLYIYSMAGAGILPLTIKPDSGGTTSYIHIYNYDMYYNMAWIAIVHVLDSMESINGKEEEPVMIKQLLI